jgi:hypothetical protein
MKIVGGSDDIKPPSDEQRQARKRGLRFGAWVMEQLRAEQESSMPSELHCLILWHYFSAEGKLVNASGTDFTGSIRQLQERLREAQDECKEMQKAKQPYSIAVQVITPAS